MTDLPFAEFPTTYEEAMQHLDRTNWAVVNNPNPADRLYLRGKASKDGRNLGKFYNRTPVYVEEIHGDWAYVRIGRATTGYMMSKYLAFGEDADKVECAFPQLEVREEYRLNVADETTYEYVTKMRLEEPEKYLPAKTSAEYPALEQIIAQDAKLKYIYDSGVFELDVDGDRYPLISQILRKSRQILYLTPISTVKLRMKKHMLQEECDYPENNALYLMLLSGDLVTYGDEGRTKQRHIATHQIYKGVLDHSGDNEEEWYVYDISGLLREYAKEYATGSPNNLLCTTTELRDCHYRKQENNAYYHIQAINLPFQNIEFYYLTLDQKNDKEAFHEF